MSDSLRELTVSLRLGSQQFDSNIRLVNQQLKAAEREFKQASAGSDGFEKTLRGMAERASHLRKQLDLQNQIVEQYNQKLAKANERLETAQKKHTDLTSRLEREKEQRKQLQAQIKEQEKSVQNLTKTQGADSAAVQEAEGLLKTYNTQLKETDEAINKTQGQLTAVQKTIVSTDRTIQNTTVKLNETQATVKNLTDELNRNTNGWHTHGVAMQNFAQRAAGTSKTFEQVGSTLTRTITTPLLGLGAAALTASINYESAFASVRKTVNVTGDDTEAFFEGLSDTVLDMSKRLATSADAVSEVMAMAGQLGIANDQLASFTETVVRMGMSTNLSGENAASSMARFANITQMAQSEAGKLGATLVYLGNNFATTEAEIMEMSVRIAAAGTQVGLTQAQILGFAAALSSLGLEAEAGGSAFSKALKLMEVAVETSNSSLADFAMVAGMTEKEFSLLWKANPADAFSAFLSGLAQMDEKGMSAIAVLDEINITEIRLSDTLLRSANATELLANAQAGANQAWADGTALMVESDTRLQTMASRLTNLKNSVVQTGIQFGETMMPHLEVVVGHLGEAVKWFSQMDEATRQNIITWGLWAAASGPVIKGIGKVGTAVTSTINVVGKFSETIGRANDAFRATGSIASWIGTLLGPGGALMAGIAVSTAAIAGLIALFNRMEAKPNLSMDADEIARLAINIDQLQTEIDVDTSVNVTGDVLNLKQKFLGILNDGVPETTAIRNSMQVDVDKAVGEVYALIEEAHKNKKAELDELFAAGVIDEPTYNSAINTLNAQTTELTTDLETKASAVTNYVMMLCSQNRAMTQEEIDTLNSLLEVLGQTTAQVEQAATAQMQAYESAKQKVRLGIGDDTDKLMTIEGIELEYAQKINEIEHQREMLRRSTNERVMGLSDDEALPIHEQARQDEAKLDARIQEIRIAKAEQYEAHMPGLLAGTGISVAELREYYRQLKEYESEVGRRSNSITADRATAWSNDPLGMKGYAQQLEVLIAFEERVNASGLFSENSPFRVLMATLSEVGTIEADYLNTSRGMLEALIAVSGAARPELEDLATLDLFEQASQILPSAGQAISETSPDFIGPIQQTAEQAANVFPEILDMHSPSRLMYQQGLDIMAGLRNGIVSGQSGVIVAMRRAARSAVDAAKAELQIHSPSAVFENEVGVMTMKGLGKGVLKEVDTQARVIRNAARYLTSEAVGSVSSVSDNRKTYHNTSSVNVSGNTFVINDRQDIQSLAAEIAILIQQDQRGRGEK